MPLHHQVFMINYNATDDALTTISSTTKDVLAEMQAEFLEEMIRPLNKPLTQADLEYAFTYLLDHADFSKLFIQYNSYTEWIQIFKAIYQNSFDNTLVKTLDPESQQLVYAYHAGGIYFLLRQWFKDGNQKTPKELAVLALNVINKEYPF